MPLVPAKFDDDDGNLSPFSDDDRDSGDEHPHPVGWPGGSGGPNGAPQQTSFKLVGASKNAHPPHPNPWKYVHTNPHGGEHAHLPPPFNYEPLPPPTPLLWTPPVHPNVTGAATGTAHVNGIPVKKGRVKGAAAAAKPGPGQEGFRPPRPPNAWILYRTDKIKELADPNSGVELLEPTVGGSGSGGGGAGSGSGSGAAQAKMSQRIAELWRKEPESVRQHYARLAEKKKAEHHLKYPGYRFQPVRKNQKARQRRGSGPGTVMEGITVNPGTGLAPTVMEEGKLVQKLQMQVHVQEREGRSLRREKRKKRKEEDTQYSESVRTGGDSSRSTPESEEGMLSPRTSPRPIPPPPPVYRHRRKPSSSVYPPASNSRMQESEDEDLSPPLSSMPDHDHASTPRSHHGSNGRVPSPEEYSVQLPVASPPPHTR